jgi:ankyrin repeat protein
MPLDTIKFLLFHQPNLAQKVDMEGRLPLHFACQNTNLKLIELLTRLHARSLEQQD